MAKGKTNKSAVSKASVNEEKAVETKIEITQPSVSMEDLMKIVDNLTKQIIELKSQNENLSSGIKEEIIPIAEDEGQVEIDIRPDTYIKVISLVPMLLNLSTMGRGQGKIFKFNKLGEVKRITYADLVLIMEANPTFVENGYFYIMNKEVIRKHGLDDAYSKILSKEMIEEIIAGEKEAVAFYENCNDKQKEIVANILISKIRDGVELDANMVMTISRLSKINIFEKADEAKEYKE